MSKNPKHPLFASLLVLGLALFLPACVSSGGGSLDYVEVDISYFHDDLAVHGEWIQVEDWGWAWAPHGVWVDWRPYSHGCWVSTRYGWTWYSYWDWGWACFHYGRWWDHPSWGWVWIPDRVWGPAWVAWHDGPDYLGWAPLPPHCRWRRDRGIRRDGGWRRHIPDRAWCFVPDKRFDAEDLRPRLVPAARNPSLLRDSRDVTDYRWERERVVNRSLTRERIQRSVRRPITERELAWTERRSSGSRGRPDARRIEVYRPPNKGTAGASTDLTPRIDPVRVPRREPDRGVVDRELERRRDVERKRLEAIRRAEARRSISRVEIERRRRVEEDSMRKKAEREARNLEAWRKREASPTPRVTRSTRPRYEPTPRASPAPRSPVTPRTVQPRRPTQPTRTPRTVQPGRRTQPSPTPRTVQPRRPTQPTKTPRTVQPARRTQPSPTPRTVQPRRPTQPRKGPGELN